MEQAIQLFGFLILTMLGFVLPTVAILLSIFQEGISKLASQYEADKFQSENNIKKQLKKLAKTKSTDVLAIRQSLDKLESIKQTAESSLSYLYPKKTIIRLFMPLMVAFLGVVVTFLMAKVSPYYYLFLVLSLASFVYALFVLWKVLGIIVEVRKIIDTDKKETDSKTIELLSTLVEKATTEQHFLQKVYIRLNDRNIIDSSSIIKAHTNVKQELSLAVDNDERRIAKTIQIGSIFPTNFIVEKERHSSVYRDETRQIIRDDINLIHGHTLYLLNPLIITPLERGSYVISTFIKGESIEATYRDVTIEVA